MLQLQYIRQERDAIVEALKKRFFDAETILDNILDADKKRRETQTQLDNNTAEANKISKQIGQLFKTGKKEEAEALRAQTGKMKEENKALQEAMNKFDQELTELLYQIPNVPHETVIAGKSDEENEEIYRKGEIPTLSEKALPHWELAKDYNLIDFELGVKISGAGFPVYIGKGARLQRALINYFLDEATKAGYTETLPPHLVNEASGIGTGQLPDKEGQMYHATADDLYLIPTAEVPITNIYRDVILSEADFPIKHCGYTPCFRREAGSYGKDVRGLNRLHQFDKVEIVQIAHPDQSFDALEIMVKHVETLLENLNLPYRKLRLCGGDLGFTSTLTFDLEVYSTAQEKWLEVSSISNFLTFQANRLKCRFRNKEGKTELAHTLNGSALALPRILAALLENNQTEEGIKIPDVLVPYTGFDMITK